MHWIKKLIIISLICILPVSAKAYEPKAKQIQNEPAGNISSTNVQDAINELDQEKLGSESDPVFTAVDHHFNWNAAYSWGNHALAGYYKSGDNPTFGTLILGSGYSVSGIEDKDFCIIAPDLVRYYHTSGVIIFHVDPDKYPYGIKLLNVQISLWSNAAYTFVFKEYSSAMVEQNTIESLSTTASTKYAEARTTDIDDSDIDADDYIVGLLPSTDVSQVAGKIIFYRKGS